MMGMTMPTQSSLSDLMTLLQLLQAASDPKTSKAAIEKISEARKQYDDAIAESGERHTAALNAANQAGVAQAKAEAAEAKAEKKLAALDAKTADVNAAAAALAQDRSDFETYKTEIAALARVNVAAKTAQDASHKKAMDAVDAQRKALDAQAEDLTAKLAEAQSIKDEFIAKLAQFKALTV